VFGSPIHSKPSKVVIKLRLGFFDVLVLGHNGERLVFRLPLRRAASDPSCKGIMVANFNTASVGLIDSIALVGPMKLPALAVDVLARGSAPDKNFQIPLELASSLVLSPPAPPLSPAPDALQSSPLTPSEADPTLLRHPSLAASPVAATVWHSPPVPAEPRRSSRLILADPDNYVSIVDKAILRKQKLNESQASHHRSSRRGELDADDLLAVAVEDGCPMPPRDVLSLAMACDISAADLDLEIPSSPAGSPQSWSIPCFVLPRMLLSLLLMRCCWAPSFVCQAYLSTLGAIGMGFLVVLPRLPAMPA
jgi:hypothetical protein